MAHSSTPRRFIDTIPIGHTFHHDFNPVRPDSGIPHAQFLLKTVVDYIPDPISETFNRRTLYICHLSLKLIVLTAAHSESRLHSKRYRTPSVRERNHGSPQKMREQTQIPRNGLPENEL